MAQLDWSVGEVLSALKKYGLEENTLVIFTSDNGPAAGEGSTYEGGVREPFAAKWPGHIPAGKTADGVAATIDLLPTFAGIIGAALPEKSLDGVDIWSMFTGKQQSVDREVLLYWSDYSLEAARLGKWKLRFKSGSSGMGMGMPGGMEGGMGASPGGGQGQNANAGGAPGGMGGAGMKSRI